MAQEQMAFRVELVSTVTVSHSQATERLQRTTAHLPAHAVLPEGDSVFTRLCCGVLGLPPSPMNSARLQSYSSWLQARWTGDFEPKTMRDLI